MQTTLDRFGRIIIPKDVRDKMGLAAGAVLQVEKEGQRLILHPVRDELHIKDKRGILVFTGEAEGDVGGALQEYRKTRLKKMARLTWYENSLRYLSHCFRDRRIPSNA